MDQDLSNKLSFLKNSFLREVSFHSGRLLNKPTFVSLETSELCCLRCRQCDLWQNKKAQNRLTFEEKKEAILKLKTWLKRFKINFTGGEPFLERETIPLISFAARLGISTFVNSNGYVIDEEMAKKIVESGLDHLSISLDSSKPEVHDSFRGVKGVTQRAVRAVELVKEYRGRKKFPLISLTSIIMKDNLDDLNDLVSLVKKLNLDGNNFQVLMSKYSFGSRPYDSLWYKKNPLWPNNTQKTSRIIKQLISLKKSGFSINNPVSELERFRLYFADPDCFNHEACLVGLSNFAVDIRGDVRLCFTMPPIGNIKNYSPEEIWKGKEAKKRRIEIKNCQKNCRLLLCNRKLSPGQILKEAFFRWSKKIT